MRRVGFMVIRQMGLDYVGDDELLKDINDREI